MIYFDNNATTLMAPETINEMVKYCNKGNPSSGYLSAEKCKDIMRDLQSSILQLSGANDYRIIFTSGASESNCMILRGIIDAYNDTIGRPHIITSSVEHKSVLLCIQSLEARDIIDATYIDTSKSGHVDPAEIRAAIRNNTALICIMAANNETGAINDIARITSIAHANNIPFHSDAVQIFGKMPALLSGDGPDSICISFHKFGGPPGIGALIVKEQLLSGYKIQPIIFGTQNGGLRGGTENIPAIAAAKMAVGINFTDRTGKNAHTLKLKKYLMTCIGKIFPSRDYVDYIYPRDFEIVFLSGIDDYLVNTILLSVVKTGAPICNVKIKDALEAKSIVVSIGSACNTSSPKASHVLYSMGCDEYIRRGALRISLGDLNTISDCKIFLREFAAAVKAQL